MNDRWFNFAIAITIFTIMANGFLLMASLQPDQNGHYNPLFEEMSNSKLTYSQIKVSSNVNIGQGSGSNGDSSTTPTSEQGFTPITNTNTGNPVGLNMLDYAFIGAVGFESIMYKLASVFMINGVLNPIFLALAGIGFFSKTILIAYLGSVLLRPIFGRVW